MLCSYSYKKKTSEYAIIIAFHGKNLTRILVNGTLCIHCLSCYCLSSWRSLRIAVDFSVCILPFLSECSLCVCVCVCVCAGERWGRSSCALLRPITDPSPNISPACDQHDIEYSKWRMYKYTYNFMYNIKVKVKFTLEQATNTQAGDRGIAVLFL